MATNEGAVLSEVEKGTVADTRRSPLVEPPHAPPEGYIPLGAESIRGLSKIAGSQEAELAMAAKQVVDKGDTLRTRFGELAPDTAHMGELWQRYQDATAAYKVAVQLVTYFGDISQVAAHDVLQVLGLVDETVRPASARNAKLADEFSAVLRIADQRGDTIRQGIARVQAAKKVTPATPPASPTGEGTPK